MMQLVSQSVCFEELAEQRCLDGIATSGISQDRLLDRIRSICSHYQSDLDETELKVLAEFVFGNALMRPSQKLEGINGRFNLDADDAEDLMKIEDFCWAAGSHEININTIVHLFDREWQPGLLERFFFSSDVWRPSQRQCLQLEVPESELESPKTDPTTVV